MCTLALCTLCAIGIISHIGNILALSGHVCSRQHAQTYTQQYDRAFVCPERYTTACGQLDWRRCTKYRVSTCHTPSERYATRYRVVEECCPGWRDAGGGSCAQPVCPGSCLNGGICADVGGVPGCSCTEGYYGDRCEQEKNSTGSWNIVLVSLVGFLVVIVTAVSVLMVRRRHPRRSSMPPLPLSSIPSDTATPGTTGRLATRPVPSAPPTLCE